MTISALFGYTPSRENRNAYGSQSSSSNSSFASQLDAATSEVEQARESAVVKLSAASSTTTNSATTSTDAASTTGTTSASQSGSQTESLGSDADVYATFAGAGITMTCQPIGDLPVFSGADSSGTTSASQSASSGKSENDTLSESAMESLVSQFGGSTAEADQLFTMLGGTPDGTVSNSQMLNALSQTEGNSGSQLSQMLMGLMDTNGNHVVSGSEINQFEISMVNAEHNSVS